MLTLEKVRELAALEVERMGDDFVYSTPDTHAICLYVPTTDPRAPAPDNDEEVSVGAHLTGCLVGSIITRAGMMTDYIAGSNLSVGSLMVSNELVVDTEDTQVRRYLRTLQAEQDGGATWGEAFRMAEQSVSAP